MSLSNEIDKLRRDELDDVKNVMGTASGRRLVWRILEQTRIFGATFNTDPMLMSHSEGQRNIGLFLFSDVMEACPEKYLTMVKGVQEREERRHGRPGNDGHDHD